LANFKENNGMEVLERVPKTALDIFRQLPEGTLCEVIDNILYMSPAPKYTHQRLLLLLAKKISDHAEKTKIGEAFISPVDVYFEDLLSAVQPDIIYVSKENSGIINEDGYFYGAPDLIIEILSSDKKRDTVTKKNLYEKAGVKEYFIINPADRKIFCYTLDDVYKMVYEDLGNFKSQLLGFQFTF
jgi:Uma2 family endonuclease